MDAAREERVRVAKEVFGLVVGRWYTAEQVKPELDYYVQQGILQALQDRKLAKLIERVSQLPPAQIAPDEVERIMNPVASEDDEQARQQRVAYQLEQVLGDYDNQNPEVIRMYGMMMENPPRSDEDLRRFADYFATTLPPDSPNRARIQGYLRATAPQPNYPPQSNSYPSQSGASSQSAPRPSQQRPVSQSAPQPSQRSYSSPAPVRPEVRSSVSVERAPMPQKRISREQADHDDGSIFGGFSGSFPGGCLKLLVYVIGLGIAGAIALLLFGAFLVQNTDFYSTDVGQGLGAATGYISTGMGVFFWLRQQTSSKLMMARFVVMLLGSAAVMYFVVSSGLIDLNALANTSASDREQLLGLGTMAVSGATTVYLWVKNLLRQLFWLALLALVGGGGLAVLFYTGAIDVDAMMNTLRGAFGG